jgi:hypothetical protein
MVACKMSLSDRVRTLHHATAAYQPCLNPGVGRRRAQSNAQ